jgi:hypothetical protein
MASALIRVHPGHPVKKPAHESPVGDPGLHNSHFLFLRFLYFIAAKEKTSVP